MLELSSKFVQRIGRPVYLLLPIIAILVIAFLAGDSPGELLYGFGNFLFGAGVIGGVYLWHLENRRTRISTARDHIVTLMTKQLNTIDAVLLNYHEIIALFCRTATPGARDKLDKIVAVNFKKNYGGKMLTCLHNSYSSLQDLNSSLEEIRLQSAGFMEAAVLAQEFRALKEAGNEALEKSLEFLHEDNFLDYIMEFGRQVRVNERQSYETICERISGNEVFAPLYAYQNLLYSFEENLIKVIQKELSI